MMSLSPMTVQYLVLGAFSAVWLGMYRLANALSQRGDEPFHVAADKRDRRKARFYYNSVWLGLGMGFLSFLCLQALANSAFETLSTRDAVLGVVRGLGLWGLLIVGAVWSQVGQRVGLPNSDGTSLQASSENHTEPRFPDRRFH